MPGMEEETEFFEGPPAVQPEGDEDEWFESAQMGKVHINPNNELRGGDDGIEIE